ncbi:hypothetical protein [Caballeronia humi]|uniref:hypothetical protein n=1 Tax=Caballeronia humi TaxID=326474 RepID=UPI00135C9199|nr:hypothetical protein [Caballeronia humi]
MEISEPGTKKLLFRPSDINPWLPVPDVVTELSPVRAITPPAFGVVAVRTPIALAPLVSARTAVPLITPPAASNALASSPLVVTEERLTFMDAAVGSVELA